MCAKPRVYLAGPIAGTTYSEATDWREHVKARLGFVDIQAFSPMRDKGRLADIPVLGYSYDTLAGQKSPLTSARGLTTRDRNDCMRCDLLFVNFLGACERASIGTAMEVAWADSQRIPIVLCIEDDGSNIHDHPMIIECAGYRLATLEEAIAVTKSVLTP